MKNRDVANLSKNNPWLFWNIVQGSPQLMELAKELRVPLFEIERAAVDQIIEWYEEWYKTKFAKSTEKRRFLQK
jgi:hypothetical protein